MKVLYLDCGMGAAGDMLSAALLELLPDPDAFVEKLNSLGIPEVEFIREKTQKCGITGTHLSVKVHGTEESSEMFEHGHEHSHEHGHEHELELELEHEHPHDHEHEHLHDHEHEHLHDHEHEHLHDHEHEHLHDHEHEHLHDHQHGHSHEHGHGHLHGHSHVHRGMDDIRHIIKDHLSLPSKVADDVLSVYGIIAEAESHAHGVPVTEIHFHEVGTMDAIADITAFCLLMNEIAPDEVVASPIHVGSGTVRCTHGILPVPAPATAFILQGIPIYGGTVKGELCTPTGAALLKYFATRFGEMPMLAVNAIGYGMGKKDFDTANCVRALLGETAGSADTVVTLSCNIDDMTPEEIGFAMNRLFEGGAREVFTVPAGMKKNRPGVILEVICSPADEEKMVKLLFKYTSTIGVRETLTKRFVLDRTVKTVSTEYGDVRVKESTGYGVTRRKYEYEDLSRIAQKHDMTLAEVKSKAKA